MINDMSAKNLDFLLSFFKDKQQSLAKILGVTQSTISDYKNGIKQIKTEFIPIIAYRYGISCNDFLTKDLSLSMDFPLSLNLDYCNKAVFKMFPIRTSKIAQKDANFNRAYEITNELFKLDDIDAVDSKICIFEHALELYDKAWTESKTYVALSNSISLILILYGIYCQRNIDPIVELQKKKNPDIIEVRQTFLRDPTKRTKTNKYEGKRKAFLEKYDLRIFDYIKLLKSNLDYSELGDYYLALCYYVGFVDLEMDYETYLNTSMLMLAQQAILENPYAITFFECTETIINTENITKHDN